MSICSFDWELASKFIPLLTPIVAWYIFRQWKKQKGAESLSNIAKEIYEVIEVVKMNLINVEDITCKYIRSSEKDKRDIYRQDMQPILKDFNKSTNQLISKVEIVNNYLDNRLDSTTTKIREFRNDINMYVGLADKEFFKKGYLLTNEENKYIGKIGKNTFLINNELSNENLLESLISLIIYK